MNVSVRFYSYFKDLTGCEQTAVQLPDGATIAELKTQLHSRFPRLVEMERSTLIAVGMEYQNAEHQLTDNDQVSFFPPVQGG